jgi:hypothetical protein
MPYREPARRPTRYLRFCLDVLTKPTSCSMPWETMTGEGCTRVCPECSLEVHDVAAMNATDAEAFLAERMAEAPKLRLHRRPDGRVLESDCPRGVRERRMRRVGWGLAAIAFVAIAIALLRT